MVVNLVEEVDLWMGLSNPGLSNPIQEGDLRSICQGRFHGTAFVLGFPTLFIHPSIHPFFPLSILHPSIHALRVSDLGLSNR